MTEGTSTFSAAANLAKLCIGVGVLALPYATSVGGLLFAPLVIAVVASWNAVACSKMVECKDACYGMDFPAHLSSTYSKIAYAGAGEIGVIVTDVSIIVTLIGVCIAYQITFAQLLQQIPWTNFDTTTLSIAFAFLALPLCCVPNIGVLAVFSLIGLVCLVVSVVAIIVYGVLLYGSAAWEQPFSHVSFGGHDNHLSAIVNDSHKHLPLWPENLSSMSSFIGVATFCFGLCSLAFPVLESMRDKRQFGTAVFWSLLFVWFVYVLLGDVGALLYVEAAAGIRDNILSNLPTDSFVALLVRLAMTAVSLLTYPLTLVPPAQMLEHYMLSFAAKTAGPAAAPALLSRDSAKGAYGAVELADIETETETAETTALNTPVRGSEDSLSSRDSAACASLEISQSGHILTRALMVISTTFIATCIPCFGIVIALLGGFTVTILSFVLPSYLHLQIVGYQCTADQTRCRHDENRRRSRVPFSKADPPAGSDDWELEIGGTEAVSGEASRARVVQEDLALTAAGVLLCVVATTVTTMGFLSRVGGEGAQC